jgi:Domain of unknown function (DUF4345)
MNKKILVVVLYVLGFFAVATGLLAIVGGADYVIGGPGWSGGPHTDADVDSQLRFANAYWLVAGLILWWTARDPLPRALVTRVVLGTAVLGGLFRIISAIQLGLPLWFYWLTFGLEIIGLPLILWWHSRVFPVPMMKMGKSKKI